MELDTQSPDDRLYIVYDSSETSILDGGFEPRKGRIWIGPKQLYERYFSYVDRTEIVIDEIEMNARRGVIDDPEKYRKTLEDHLSFLRSMVVYISATANGSPKNKKICFVRHGAIDELAKSYSDLYDKRAKYRRK